MVFDPSQQEKDDLALAESFGFEINVGGGSARDAWYVLSNIGADLRKRLEAVGGDSSWTLQQLEEAEKPKTVPESATIGFDNVTENSVMVFWNPHSDGGSPITGYHLVLKNEDTGQTITESNTSYNVTNQFFQNLDSGTNYKAYVIVINAVGNSFEQSNGFKTLGVTTPTYDFIIESDGMVRMFRLGAVEYTEIKVSPDSVQSYIDRGVSRLLTASERAIPYPRTEPEPEPEPEPIIISVEVQAILTKFDNNDYTFPSWFSSNIEFVKNGSITSNEFLNAFNNLVEAGTIIDKTIVITYCVNVYTLDSGGNVLSDHYDKINLSSLQNLLSENKYVFYCKDGIIPTEQQVRDFYGYTAPVEDSSINSMMISQTVGAFILKDGRLKGEILYIANQSFNPFYYDKNLTSLVQIKSKTGIPIAVKPNNLNFTNTERDERIQIDEAVGNFKELIVDFFVLKSPTDMRAFAENKQIQVIEEPPYPECEVGFHKDFSGKCVEDDPKGEIPRDKLIDTLKGFLFGTVALSLLARKY